MSISSGYIFLVLSVILGITANGFLKTTEGFTNIFPSLPYPIIPIVGPIIVNLFTIPFFWLMNGMGYFSSVYAIKKGYGRDIISHRLITITLLTGIVLGYILGHLIPVN